MASQSGRKSASVSQQLTEEPYRFDFFQAVRLLERIAQEKSESDPAYRRYPVGKDHPPHQEIVHFRALVSQSFPPAEIASLTDPRYDEPSDPHGEVREMVVSFMGMTGPAGVLPRHYTQLVIDRTRKKDFALRNFWDLFNHRAISLFYRAWEKYRLPVAYERAARDSEDHEEDLATRCLYSLIGLGTPGLRGRLELDDQALLYYAGHFAHFPRSAVSLELMIEDYFELPAKVLQFQGQWLYLSEEDQSRMPTADEPQGQNMQLGVNVVVGERVWSIESKFRIRLGPLTYRQFQRLTPRGDTLVPLSQMIRTYAGPELDFDVQPVLLADEVPACQLGGDDSDPSCLGWNTWLSSQPLADDVDEAVFVHSGSPT